MKTFYIVGTSLLIGLGIVFLVVMYWTTTHWGNETNESPIIPEMIAKSYYDSLRIKDSVLIADCELQSKKKDTIVNNVEVLIAAYKTEQALNKKLRDSLFKQNWRIVKAKHYIKIVQRNPHDLVFLVGWLNNQCFN